MFQSIGSGVHITTIGGKKFHNKCYEKKGIPHILWKMVTNPEKKRRLAQDLIFYIYILQRRGNSLIGANIFNKREKNLTLLFKTSPCKTRTLQQWKWN